MKFYDMFHSIMYVLGCINSIAIGFFLISFLIFLVDNKNLRKVILISVLIVLDVFVFIVPDIINLIVFVFTGKMI